MERDVDEKFEPEEMCFERNDMGFGCGVAFHGVDDLLTLQTAVGPEVVTKGLTGPSTLTCQ